MERSSVEKEIEKVEQLLEKYKLLQENIEQYYNIQSEISNLRGHCPEWRNTKTEYWYDITKKYDEKQLLNCYGDIFYIVKTETIDGITTHTGKRVLWNLKLSRELYHIEEHIEYERDDDGCEEYCWTDYEIYYWGDDE